MKKLFLSTLLLATTTVAEPLVGKWSFALHSVDGGFCVIEESPITFDSNTLGVFKIYCEEQDVSKDYFLDSISVLEGMTDENFGVMVKMIDENSRPAHFYVLDSVRE